MIKIILQVLWYKNGVMISQAISSTMKNGKYEDHVLTIPSMSDSDYGNYSCVAKNNLGTATDHIFLSGIPTITIIQF